VTTPDDETTGDIVRVAIARHEVEAELMCELLRSEQIDCIQRLSDIGVAGYDGAPGGFGAREVLVRTPDLERARELLALGSKEDGE
jgi:hypothetical protein